MPKPYAWAEINLAHLRHNFKEIKRRVGRDKNMIAVVKSNAYGHGMAPVARELDRLGVTILAVAIVDEAEALRAAKPAAPIMILSRTLPEDADRVVRGNFIQCVGSYQEAKELAAAAARARKKIRVHIKVDTGMNRLGIQCENAFEAINKIVLLENIKAEGILTHFIESDQPRSLRVKNQLEKFNHLLFLLKCKGIAFKYIHCANSGATINIPRAYFNTVRVGLSLYGYYPGDDNFHNVRLKPLLSLKSRIINVRTVDRRETVSYGARWTAKKKTQVAVISIGYSDGYPRHFTGVGQMLINGVKTPVLGTVCMNHTMVDVGRVKNVKIGDEAVLYGRQGKAEITLEKAAKSIGTIPYELTCRIRQNLERKYIS